MDRHLEAVAGREHRRIGAASSERRPGLSLEEHFRAIYGDGDDAASGP